VKSGEAAAWHGRCRQRTDWPVEPGDIRKHLEITPFVPFSVRTSDGREYLVPTIDHIYLPPSGGRVVISDDQGVVVVLPGLMISGLVHPNGGRHPE
jgi:hypothetical protein